MSTYKNYLTNEEQQLLEKLVDKMQSGFSEKEFQEGRKANVEQLAKDASDPDFFNQPREIKHVTNYQREIFIKLNAEISTACEQTNKLLEAETLVENFYHIPVPSGVNYAEKIDEFVKIFDNEAEHVAIKINTNDKQEKE